MSNEKDDSRTSIFSTRVEPDKSIKPANDACFVIISGNEENKKFNLFTQKESDIPIDQVSKKIKIGRSINDNEIILFDKFVSSSHALIEQSGENFYIDDRKSRNGTFLNEEKINEKTLLRNQDKIKMGNTILKFLQGDVEALFLDNLRRKVNIDGLTGAYNKQYFEDNFKSAFFRAKRYDNEFAIIIFDIDDFKRINDNYGHNAGDYVLSTLAKVIKSRVRETDIFSRIGGEEFAIICAETGIENSYRLAEVIRQLVENTDFIYETIKIPVTISLGVCELNESMNDEKDMFKACDLLLYNSKKTGKNKVSR